MPATENEAWRTHQQTRKMKKGVNSNGKDDIKLSVAALNSKGKDEMQSEDLGRKQTPQEHTKVKEVVKISSKGNQKPAVKVKRANKVSQGNVMKMRMPAIDDMTFHASFSKHKDIDIERKLAKKLKVKGGKLRGEDDCLNLLFEGMPSVFEEDGVNYDEKLHATKSRISLVARKRKKKNLAKGALESTGADDCSEGICEPRQSSAPEVALNGPSSELYETEKHKKRKFSRETKTNDDGNTISMRGDSKRMESNEMATPLEAGPIQISATKSEKRYIPPHLRSRAGNESEEHTETRRQVF